MGWKLQMLNRSLKEKNQRRYSGLQMEIFPRVKDGSLFLCALSHFSSEGITQFFKVRDVKEPVQ